MATNQNHYWQFRQCTSRPPTLKRDDTGWWVRMLRRLLMAHGTLSKSETVTDYFDWRVYDAVVLFQESRKLHCDGIVGAETWSHLALPDLDTLGRKTLQIALHEAYRGAREIGGNNKGEWVETYCAGTGMSNIPWCVCFATWAHRVGCVAFAVHFPLRERLSSSRLYVEAREKKLLTGTPDAGDFALIKGGSTGHKHTAIVSHVMNNFVWVVEGNVGASIWMPWKRDLVRVGKYRLSACDFAKGSI